MLLIRTALLGLALSLAAPLAAQTNITLGAINADPSAPVEISADSLSVDQDTGRAIFSGNVVIGQDDLRLSASEVRVIYNQETGDIDSLSMSGGVTFVTSTEAAEAQSAEYNLQTGVLTLTGNVLVSQGVSAISADRMRIDLNTGGAQMDGRVRTIFNQDDG